MGSLNLFNIPNILVLVKNWTLCVDKGNATIRDLHRSALVVIDYHADVTSLPERAAEAGIRQLALYHMVPVPPNALAAKMFLRGIPESVIVTRDLHAFDLPANSTDIVIREP